MVDRKKYDVRQALEKSEAVPLIEQGYEYVCTLGDFALFRKKR
jgi:hypothetical protein